MANSVIASTRRGFAYQDKYALLTYFRSLETGRPFSFYVDFPIGQKSLDIRVAFADKDEEVLEVKTGESFKDDGATGDQTEVQDALEALYDHWAKNEGAKIKLVISPDFRGRVLAYWSDLKIIHESVRLSARTRPIAARQHRRLGFARRRVPMDRFVPFIRATAFISEFDDLVANDRDRHSDIEDAIIAKIGDLADACGAASASFKITDRDVLYHLLQHMMRHCGTGQDVGPVLLGAIADIFSRRMLVAAVQAPANEDEVLRQKRAQVELALGSLTKSVVPPAATPAATQATEGSTI